MNRSRVLCLSDFGVFQWRLQTCRLSSWCSRDLTDSEMSSLVLAVSCCSERHGSSGSFFPHPSVVFSRAPCKLMRNTQQTEGSIPGLKLLPGIQILFLPQLSSSSTVDNFDKPKNLLLSVSSYLVSTVYFPLSTKKQSKETITGSLHNLDIRSVTAASHLRCWDCDYRPPPQQGE